MALSNSQSIHKRFCNNYVKALELWRGDYNVRALEARTRGDKTDARLLVGVDFAFGLRHSGAATYCVLHTNLVRLAHTRLLHRSGVKVKAFRRRSSGSGSSNDDDELALLARYLVLVATRERGWEGLDHMDWKSELGRLG